MSLRGVMRACTCEDTSVLGQVKPGQSHSVTMSPRHGCPSPSTFHGPGLGAPPEPSGTPQPGLPLSSGSPPGQHHPTLDMMTLGSERGPASEWQHQSVDHMCPSRGRAVRATLVPVPGLSQPGRPSLALLPWPSWRPRGRGPSPGSGLGSRLCTSFRRRSAGRRGLSALLRVLLSNVFFVLQLNPYEIKYYWNPKS